MRTRNRSGLALKGGLATEKDSSHLAPLRSSGKIRRWVCWICILYRQSVYIHIFTCIYIYMHMYTVNKNIHIYIYTVNINMNIVIFFLAKILYQALPGFFLALKLTLGRKNARLSWSRWDSHGKDWIHKIWTGNSFIQPMPIPRIQLLGPATDYSTGPRPGLCAP